MVKQAYLIGLQVLPVVFAESHSDVSISSHAFISSCLGYHQILQLMSPSVQPLSLIPTV